MLAPRMLNMITPFDVEVEVPSQRSSSSVKPPPDASPKERIRAEVLTTPTIISWPAEQQHQLRVELASLMHSGFPKMAIDESQDLVEHYFRRPWQTLQRYAMLLRNNTHRLIGSYLFDYGEVDYQGKLLSGCYVILNLLVPEYQGLGLGKMMAAKIVFETQPGVLLITCYQSSILHAYVDLLSKQTMTAYDVYPRLETQDGKDRLFTVPYPELDFAIQMFKILFWGVVTGDEEKIANALNNLTIHLVRKDNHAEVYNFHPWQRAGRGDRLAQALGATERDAIVVMFRRKTVEKC